MMPEPHPPHPPTPNLTLRARRLALNLTQSELAELLRATAAHHGENLACCEKRVGRWERGEVSWPSAIYRRTLLQVFNAPDAVALGFRSPREAAPSPGAPSPAPTSPLLDNALAAQFYRWLEAIYLAGYRAAERTARRQAR